MGARNIRGGTHSSTALSGSRGSHGGSGSHSCWRLSGGRSSQVGAVSRGRGGTEREQPESASSTGLHHARARGGEEMERVRGGALETGNGDVK